ncbi:MAG TPA: hypothetical protein VJJ73_00775, partial [Candidatus Paceibacterota bacterium]
NISSVGIIYRGESPDEIFIEVKDDEHPIVYARRKLCFIGGNWIGEGAKSDRGPLDTFKRELREELSFDRPIRSSVELRLLGMATGTEEFKPSPQSTQPTELDRHQLENLKLVICRGIAPFGTFLNTVPKKVLDAADPENKREGFTTLACYWVCALDEVRWRSLCLLQKKFGNLSNESLTLITTLHEIIESGTRMYGHDLALKNFFIAMGFPEARKIVNYIECEEVGTALATYEDYLERYEVVKRP